MPVLLAVIPHPDDESYSFGGTIALAARAGWDCRVVCATSGEGGQRHDGGPTGPDNVGPAREAELARSCKVLGAAPPTVWRVPDGGLASLPSQAGRIAELLREAVPELVLTLGADGGYGHPDHVAVHRWVVEGWRMLPAPRPVLLFAAFRRGLFLPQYEKCIAMMGSPPSPAPDQVGATPWHHQVDISSVADTKLAAIAAHRSQLPTGDPSGLFPPGIVAQLLEVERFSDADPVQHQVAASLLGTIVPRTEIDAGRKRA